MRSAQQIHRDDLMKPDPLGETALIIGLVAIAGSICPARIGMRGYSQFVLLATSNDRLALDSTLLGAVSSNRGDSAREVPPHPDL